MIKNTEIINKIDEVRAKITELKSKRLTVGYVPTMGALHIGHESLIKMAKRECDVVVVSIFVNPTQFGPNEDFDKYPRQLEQDRELCAKHGVELIFAPTKNEMYPEENNTSVVPHAFYQNRLCGMTRQGHFNGVATIVLKLFNIISPDKAYFGEKDAQQLAIIKKMVRDLNVPVEIVPCPTIREPDGLAYSSRNLYLSDKARQKALTLHKALQISFETGNIENAKKHLHPDVQLEYFENVQLDDDRFIAIAANVDGVRLIDNLRL